MNYIKTFVGAAGLAMSLAASNLPAQEARPDAPIDFEQVIAGARAARMRQRPRTTFATSMRSPAAPRSSKDSSLYTRLVITCTPRSGPTSST